MKNSIFLSLILLCSQIYSTDGQIILRHRESKGIGYHKGYSSLAYFLIYPQPQFDFLLDLRAHCFNDGRYATNAGLGLRFVTSPFSLIGGNIFYDFRQHHLLEGHQIGGGLEYLSHDLDLRINGYFPIGKKRQIYSQDFLSFSDNLVLTQLTMKSFVPCVEGELGGNFIYSNIYIAGGAYYLFSQNNGDTKFKNILGGKARACIDLGPHFTLGVDVSYDSVFKTRLQGVLTLRIPFGDSQISNIERNPHLTPVVRHEIIPIQVKQMSPIPLRNKENEEINVVFVDNSSDSSGNGTIAHPFRSLKEAETYSKPGDIIYVFPGKNTSENMDEGIQLKENQILASSGMPLDVEGIQIPPLTPEKFPIIINRNPLEPVIRNPGNSNLNGFRLGAWPYFDKTLGLTSNGHSYEPRPVFSPEYFSEKDSSRSGSISKMSNRPPYPADSVTEDNSHEPFVRPTATDALPDNRFNPGEYTRARTSTRRDSLAYSESGEQHRNRTLSFDDHDFVVIDPSDQFDYELLEEEPLQ